MKPFFCVFVHLFIQPWFCLFSVLMHKQKSINQDLSLLFKMSSPKLRSAPFNSVLMFLSSVEHPAGGYRKMFETVEELNEPIPAQITGRKKEQAIQVCFIFYFLGGILLLFQS